MTQLKLTLVFDVEAKSDAALEMAKETLQREYSRSNFKRGFSSSAGFSWESSNVPPKIEQL